MKSGKNVLLILAFVVILPIGIYTVLEISTLNEDEALLEEIYREQLGAAIFSVNQYSTDLVNYYLSQIQLERQRSEGIGLLPNELKQGNLALVWVAAKNGQDLFIDAFDSTWIDEPLAAKADSIFIANDTLINRLQRYAQVNYSKPEPLGSFEWLGDEFTLILTAIDDTTSCLLAIHARNFAEDLLAPRLQQMADERVFYDIRDARTNEPILRLDRLVDTEVNQNALSEQSALWLIPFYEIGVSFGDKSAQTLINERTSRNVISLVLLIILVSIGLLLVIRGVRKEMDLSKAKSDFVANVSHEIRTPLSLISLFNETLLLGRVSSDRKQEYHEIIDKETNRLKNIINKILSFSQIEAGERSYQLMQQEGTSVVEEVYKTYTYHLESKGFSHALVQNHRPVDLRLDKEAFTESLVNLIDNAMKYSDINKSVRISTQVNGDRWEVAVKDQGRGIPNKSQEQVFEKFFRVRTGDLYDSKGTGLGLSLVRSVMEAHGGGIKLDSKVGVGSTFTIWFPLNERT